MTEPLPTIRQLEEAMKSVLGERVYDALKHHAAVSRPSMHKDAMAQAFVQRREDEHAEILRTMWIVLSARGLYPSECWREE